jgi:hypothetical protein
MSTVRATEASNLQILQKKKKNEQMICMTLGIIQPGGQSRFRLAASCAEAQDGKFVYFISSSVGRD